LASLFEGYGFKFTRGLAVDGEENYVGERLGGTIQLVGPADNLTSAFTLMEIPANDRSPSMEQLLGFIKHAAPKWPEGQAWLNKALAEVGQSQEVTATPGNLEVKMTAIGRVSVAVNLKVKE
jgi:hypothetical protein